ncbi:MAG: amidohydrolase family protein [Caldilineaceae bacterium]
MIIDTHLHFWDWATYPKHPWIEDKPMLHRSFLPPDVKPHFDACGVDKGVIIEAGVSHDLNLWWLDVARQYDYVGAAVLGCRLEQPDLLNWFDQYGASPYFVGMRTSPVGPPDTWMDNAAAQNGLAEMARRDLVLELLVGYSAFPAVAKIAAAHPHLRMILDHCANPPIRERQLDAWAAALIPLAKYPNIHIKYSSALLYTYPEPAAPLMQPVANLLFEHFGAARMMWGSNWPVELLGGAYEDAFMIMQQDMPTLSADEYDGLFGANAALFYKVQ